MRKSISITTYLSMGLAAAVVAVPQAVDAAADFSGSTESQRDKVCEVNP